MTDMEDIIGSEAALSVSVPDNHFIRQLREPSVSSQQPLQKMLLDYCFTLCLLIALALPFGIIALLIKIDSRGPVFFRQPRVGLNNRTFLIYKFRTMYNGASDVYGSQLTIRNHPRITRLGAWLRRYSIDEFPQLFNVLIGDMSLVGPRPHPLQAKVGDKVYSEVVIGYDARHAVKPGITGWAQVNGWRGETEVARQIEQRVAHDLEYIKRTSLKFDIWIMILTIVRIGNDNAF